MSKTKLVILAPLIVIMFTAPILPVFAVSYSPGVTIGNYVRYGNFAGLGPGVEYFNDYDWLKLEVVSISGNEVTLQSTGQFKNGTAIPGNGSMSIWNVETGTENGEPQTQGPIIAANLNQNDAIPPPNTFYINATENLTYLNVVRSINLLDVRISTDAYNQTLTYAYDRLSGMLLETATQTIQIQPQQTTTTFSYEVIETNIFGSATAGPTPSPTIPEISPHIVAVFMLLAIALVSCVTVLQKKKLKH